MTQSGNIIAILAELESVLNIDNDAYSSDKPFQDVMKEIRKSLTITYGVDLNGDVHVDDILKVESEAARALHPFADSIDRYTAHIALWCSICRYESNSPCNLENVQNFGLVEKQLYNVLVNLSSANVAQSQLEHIRTIENKFTIVKKCLEKRMMYCLCVAYELGLWTLVNVLAEAFVFGGIINGKNSY